MENKKIQSKFPSSQQKQPQQPQQPNKSQQPNRTPGSAPNQPQKKPGSNW